MIKDAVFSLGVIGWRVYELTNSEFLIGLGFIFAGVVLSWNDWRILFKGNR